MATRARSKGKGPAIRLPPLRTTRARTVPEPRIDPVEEEDCELFASPSTPTPQSSIDKVSGSAAEASSSSASNANSVPSSLEIGRTPQAASLARLDFQIVGELVYPPQCKEVNAEMGENELIRRLKMLSSAFQSMSQDGRDQDEYAPLCLHLVSDEFLTHPNSDVQLLIACCIADILRIYAPEAPYKEHLQIHTIFMFLVGQLKGLKNPRDAAFKRYFYLLENLAYVKSFNLCHDVENFQEIFKNLFHTIFSVVSDEHSETVKAFMLDLLCPLIAESNDELPNDLLRIVLTTLITTPGKSASKSAIKRARDFITRCSDTLEYQVQLFLNQVLLLDDRKDEEPLRISNKVYDLIYELNVICPKIVLTVIPQLEYKLKSLDTSERLECVSLVARLFSEKGSSMAQNHPPLWKSFLDR